MTEEQARTLRERLEQIARPPSRTGYELEEVKYKDLTLQAALATLETVWLKVRGDSPTLAQLERWLDETQRSLTAPAEVPLAIVDDRPNAGDDGTELEDGPEADKLREMADLVVTRSAEWEGADTIEQQQQQEIAEGVAPLQEKNEENDDDVETW